MNILKRCIQSSLCSQATPKCVGVNNVKKELQYHRNAIHARIQVYQTASFHWPKRSDFSSEGGKHVMQRRHWTLWDVRGWRGWSTGCLSEHDGRGNSYSTEDRLHFTGGLGCSMFLALRSSGRRSDYRIIWWDLLTRKDTLAWAGGTAWNRVQGKRLAGLINSQNSFSHRNNAVSSG